jgi:hypothetical protein
LRLTFSGKHLETDNKLYYSYDYINPTWQLVTIQLQYIGSFTFDETSELSYYADYNRICIIKDNKAYYASITNKLNILFIKFINANNFSKISYLLSSAVCIGNNKIYTVV